MAGPTDVQDIAVGLLAACVASLDEAAPATTAPARRFINPGVPVDDCCEQLVVYASPVTERATKIPAGQRHRLAWINLVTFSVLIGRCIPGAETKGSKIVLPDPAELTAASAIVNADGWALWNGLHNRAADGEIFSICDDIVFGPLQARTPSGGCAGWLLDITAAVHGYKPAGS